MSSDKPLALILHRETDHNWGLPPSLEALYTPHFNIKTLKEAQEQGIVDQTQVKETKDRTVVTSWTCLILFHVHLK